MVELLVLAWIEGMILIDAVLLRWVIGIPEKICTAWTHLLNGQTKSMEAIVT